MKPHVGDPIIQVQSPIIDRKSFLIGKSTINGQFSIAMLNYQRVPLWGILDSTSGWWLTYPSEKYDFVSWDDEIPNIWKIKIHVPNHQPCSKPPTSF